VRGLCRIETLRILSYMSATGTTGSPHPERIDLIGRLDEHLRSSGLLPPGSPVTIALSGGLDSVVLLDLLVNLGAKWGWSLSAAHFDHRMREESGDEAAWVRAKCADLHLPLRIGRARPIPGSEAQARELRYRFLYRARDELGGGWLATAHQADDQAETVLFRLLRGSGLAGLSGIPARRAPMTVRPLLPFWRSELEAHARARRLDYLSDPTNLDVKYQRNWIRHELIPRLEAEGRVDLRSELVRLAGLAERAARVVGYITERAAGDLILEETKDRIAVARTRLLAYDTNVRAHLLRALAARVGPQPGRVGTRIALEFINTCSSGRSIDLSGGIRLCREFDRLLIERRGRAPSGRDDGLVLRDCRSGRGDVSIAGVRWRVRWGLGAPADDTVCGEQFACFDPTELHFPLAVRPWRPGDRIRLAGGTRKLKKVFVDHEVGRSQRRGYPLVTDQSRVLWIVGLLKSVQVRDHSGGELFWVGIARAE
jgi:tRNA(Ile)-lysidine synthase